MEAVDFKKPLVTKPRTSEEVADERRKATIESIEAEGEREKLAKQGGRTDSQIASCAPLHLTLGGKEIVVPLLAHNPCETWRAKFNTCKLEQAKLSAIHKDMNPEDMTIEHIRSLEKNILLDQVDLVVLFLELSKCGGKEILDVANDVELMAAYHLIEAVSTPLSESRLPSH